MIHGFFCTSAAEPQNHSLYRCHLLEFWTRVQCQEYHSRCLFMALKVVTTSTSSQCNIGHFCFGANHRRLLLYKCLYVCNVHCLKQVNSMCEICRNTLSYLIIYKSVICTTITSLYLHCNCYPMRQNTMASHGWGIMDQISFYQCIRKRSAASDRKASRPLSLLCF